mgnify:CR=1 FL=1
MSGLFFNDAAFVQGICVIDTTTWLSASNHANFANMADLPLQSPSFCTTMQAMHGVAQTATPSWQIMAMPDGDPPIPAK